MDTLTFNMILTGLYTLAVFWLGWLSRSWYLRTRPPAEAYRQKVCDVCHRPLGARARRTFDGHWRCADHKSG